MNITIEANLVYIGGKLAGKILWRSRAPNVFLRHAGWLWSHELNRFVAPCK